MGAKSTTTKPSSSSSSCVISLLWASLLVRVDVATVARRVPSSCTWREFRDDPLTCKGAIASSSSPSLSSSSSSCCCCCCRCCSCVFLLPRLCCCWLCGTEDDEDEAEEDDAEQESVLWGGWGRDGAWCVATRRVAPFASLVPASRSLDDGATKDVSSINGSVCACVRR